MMMMMMVMVMVMMMKVVMKFQILIINEISIEITDEQGTLITC